MTVRPILDEKGIETGMFEVPAGGRRFRALELLVKQKRLARTAPIPCVVRTEGLAEEDSLAENIQRAPLHPLDQFHAARAARRGACHRDRGHGEAALDHFTASAQGVLPDAGFQSGAVGVDSVARRRIAVPTQKAVSGLGFHNPGFPDAAVEFFQPLSSVIALVANQSAGLIQRRSETDLGEVAAASSVPGKVVDGRSDRRPRARPPEGAATRAGSQVPPLLLVRFRSRLYPVWIPASGPCRLSRLLTSGLPEGP